MNRKRFAAILAAAAVLGSCGACAAAQLSGGWMETADETVTEEDRAVFETAVDGLEDAEYEPVALLAEQVVAGTNYCFLSRGTQAGQEEYPGYYLVYIYKDLQGNAEVLEIQDIYIGLSGYDDEEAVIDEEQTEPEEVTLESLTTIGDVQRSGKELKGYGYDAEKYVCALEIDGSYYRFWADIPQDISDEIWSVDFDDPDRDQRIDELLAPLEFTQIDNLTENIPTQEELDSWIGKTGRDLLDAGCTITGYSLDNSEFWLSYGPYEILVTFSEELQTGTVIDEEGLMSPLTIKSVSYEGLGDITQF